MDPVRGFSTRAFVALMATLSGIGLPLSGLFNHWLGFEGLTVRRHAWMSAHDVLGLLFTVFAVWHVVLNRRPLLAHLRRSAAGLRVVGREALVAFAVTGGLLALAVGHALHAG